MFFQIDAPLFSITREPGFGYPVIEGMPLSLRCEIDANPPSDVLWERDPDPALSNATSLPPIHTLADGSLNITAITKQDIGWYRCTTVHEFGFYASFGYFLNVRSKGLFTFLVKEFFLSICLISSVYLTYSFCQQTNFHNWRTFWEENIHSFRRIIKKVYSNPQKKQLFVNLLTRKVVGRRIRRQCNAHTPTGTTLAGRSTAKIVRPAPHNRKVVGHQ